MPEGQGACKWIRGWQRTSAGARRQQEQVGAPASCGIKYMPPSPPSSLTHTHTLDTSRSGSMPSSLSACPTRLRWTLPVEVVGRGEALGSRK